MIEGTKKAGLFKKFKKIFRPPAWKMSNNAIRTFKEYGFNTLALSNQKYALDIYKNEQNNFPNVNYYNLNPPFIPLEKLEDMNIVYHACEWDKNYLNKNKTEDLINFLDKLDNKKFSFM